MHTSYSLPGNVIVATKSMVEDLTTVTVTWHPHVLGTQMRFVEEPMLSVYTEVNFHIIKQPGIAMLVCKHD